MKRRLHAAVVALALAAATLTACSSTRSVYERAPPAAELALDSATDRAWGCLLHGRDCDSFAAASQRSVVGTDWMLRGVWTRALGAQLHADMRWRARAWLAVLQWLEVDGATGPVADQMRVVTLEALARLAVRDRRSVHLELRSRGALIAASVAALALPTARFRAARALAALCPSDLADSPGHVLVALAADVSEQPVHPRLHSGVTALRAAPPLGATRRVRPWPAAPTAYRLAARKNGTYAVRWSLPAGSTSSYLVVSTSRPFAVWLDGTRLKALATAGGERELSFVLPAAAKPRSLVAATSVPGGGAVLHAAILGATAIAARGVTPTKEALEALPPAVLATVNALWAPAGPRATELATTFGRGPIAALLRAHLRASLSDHEVRASAADLDVILGHFAGATDARVERAARARDAGDAALARQLLAALPDEESTASGAKSGASGPRAVATERPSPALGPQRSWVRADAGFERARQALGEGLGDIATGEAERVVRAQPGDCRVWTTAVDLALDAMDRAALRRLLAQRRRCVAPSLKVADALTAMGALQAAQVELGRAATVAAWTDEAARRAHQIADTTQRPAPAAAKLAGHRSDWAAAQKALAGAGAGAQKAAIVGLDRLLLGPDGGSVISRRSYYQLGARPPWQDALRDGAQAIAQWRKDCAQTADKCSGGGAPVTFVLDQEVDVLLAGGGSIRRVHQIVAIHSERAAESLGELHVPPDGDVVLARTHNADGTITAPAATPDKESVSLRDVVSGAIVEHVLVQFVAADDGAARTTRLPPFLLASFDGPVVMSELVVLTAGRPAVPPADVAPETPAVLMVDLPGRRGGHSWRQFTWRTKQLRRVRPEPRAVRPEWTIPAVRVHRNATVEAMLQRFEEVLAAYASQRDPALDKWLSKARAAGQNPEKWRQLQAEVAANIRFVRHGHDPGSPAAAARNGSGDRATLLWFLAHKVGVDACLVRWQPWTRTPALGAPDPRDFSASALRLRLVPPGQAPRTTWMDPGLNGGLLDYLRPGVRGRPAWLVGCSDSSVGQFKPQPVPELGAARDKRTIAVDVTWRADGSAHASVVDRMDGALASLVRNFAADEKNRPRLVEQLGKLALPGWSYKWVSATELETPDAPLEIRYTADLAADPGRVTKGPQTLLIGLFPARLARIYGRLPSRRTALRFGHALDTTVTVTVANEGAKWGPLPEALSLHHQQVSYQRTVSLRNTTLVARAQIRCSMGIVPPTDYPAFARTLREVDRAETLRLQRGQ